MEVFPTSRSAPTSGPTSPAPSASAQVGTPTPYIRRKIDITVDVGEGPFGQGPGKSTVKLSGHRCSVTVTQAGQTAQVECQARIWGMNFSLMQKLSTYGDIYSAQRQFQMTIEAGDDVAGMTQIFTGTVTNAYFDGESQPDVAFQIVAYEGAIAALQPAAPISQAGAVDVATVMQGLAKQMGATFENNGVTNQLRDVYYPGTAYQQMRRVAEHAGINATLENGTLAIWPKGSPRGSGTIPLITPLSGERNYPTFSSQWTAISCLFIPLKFGNQVAVESSLWNNERRYGTVIGYTYTLESEMPGGPWFTMFTCTVKPIK